MFTHYIADMVCEKPTVESWNKAVDSFDVKALADTLESVGAGYFVISIGQNSGFYCSPNETYDRIVGLSPSKCSRRDLVADLADALKPKGIRLMVYLPSGAPDLDPVAKKALEWKYGKHPHFDKTPVPPGDEDPRLAEFQTKWESVIREWSQRWGNKVSGWWFDGCYFPDAMYRHPEAPNFASFAAAARAGNPNSLVSFNPGVFGMSTMTPEDDSPPGRLRSRVSSNVRVNGLLRRKRTCSAILASGGRRARHASRRRKWRASPKKSPTKVARYLGMFR